MNFRPLHIAAYNTITNIKENNENIKWIKNLLNEGKSGKEHPTDERWADM